MRKRMRSGGGGIWLAAGLLLLATDARGQDFFLQRVATGLDSPVFAVSPPGDAARLFIVEQIDETPDPDVGRVRILDLGTSTLLPAAFLEIPGVSAASEGGLLGLAFHPDYASNGFFYVYYAEIGNDTVLARYQVSGDPNIADAGSALTLLEIGQPQNNHNGGWMAFGPDGFLYLALGDGGGSDDNDGGHTPGVGNGQDNTNLLGSILRLDVDGDDFPGDPLRNYAIPPGNPFVGSSGADEIWLYGLRNPYRNGFDRATGDLFIADVGQGAREEIDLQPAGEPAGTNYGWRLREGTIATPSGGVGGPAPPGAFDPIYEYTHGFGPLQGLAVIGGYVYRGPVASLQGRYFFSDNLNPRIWSLVFDGSDPVDFDGSNLSDFIDHTGTPELTPDAGAINRPSSFGEDGDGNLYLVDLDGDVFRVTPLAAAPAVPVSGLALLALGLALAGGGRVVLRRSGCRGSRAGG